MKKFLLGGVAALALASASPALATISSSTTVAVDQGNGSTTVFNYSFLIPFQADEATPAVTVQTEDPNGNLVTLSPSSYVISGVGSSSGGTVTYLPGGSPLPAGWFLIISRSLAYTQPIAVSNYAFYPHTVELTSDNLAAQIQQNAQGLSQSIQFPLNDVLNYTLPSAALRANTVLGFNASGTPTLVTTTPGSGVGTTGSIVPGHCASFFSSALLQDGGACGANITNVTSSPYNAVGDATLRYSCNITASTNLLTCNTFPNTAPFTTAEIGKTIMVNGAGAAGGELITTISGVSGQTATLAANASSSTTAIFWQSEADGTDDTAPLSSALGGLSTGGCLFFPLGNYLVRAGTFSTSSKQNWCLEGSLNRMVADTPHPNIWMIGASGSLMVLGWPVQSVTIEGLGLQYAGADYVGNLFVLGTAPNPVSEVSFFDDEIGGLSSVLQGTSSGVTAGTVAGPAASLINMPSVYNVNIERSILKYATAAIVGPTDSYINANTVRIRDNYFAGGFNGAPIVVLGEGWTIEGNTFEASNTGVGSGSKNCQMVSTVNASSSTDTIRGLVIDGNLIADTTVGHGICFDFSGSTKSVNGVNIFGNVIGFGLTGVFLTNGSGWNIFGNEFQGLTNGIVGTGLSSGASGNFDANTYSSVTNNVVASSIITPRELDDIPVDAEGQTGSISATVLKFASTTPTFLPAGLYRWDYDIQATTPGSGATLQMTLSWTDEAQAETCVSSSLNAASAGHLSGTCIITADGIHNTTYAVALAGGTATYTFRAALHAQ